MAFNQALSTGHTEETSGVGSRKLAMWIFLISEVIFFSGLIGGSILIRVQTPPESWPFPGEVLDVPLTSLNTFILIVSSVTVVQALAALQDGKQMLFRIFLIATFILGSIFLGIQAYEYVKLTGHGLTFNSYIIHAGGHAAGAAAEEATGEEHSAATETAEAEELVVNSPFGTTFYIQTGFHGAHVTIGVLWLLIVIIKAFAGSYSAQNYVGVEMFGLYWHFVDLVWILLFTIVYLV
ncbi:MAG: heme-copper oxidase subunit III [Chloroflexaceae bacterium]|nr:heme-copper oxidase subunit III [Chloroflexaceae bacterium]